MFLFVKENIFYNRMKGDTMHKLKVCVYAICKNEEKFVNRWMDSMSEADKVFVLDTGSTDRSVLLLKKRGAIVKSEIINPWRFDNARNLSLDMVDEDCDICVCTDLDEVFNQGWRDKVEQAWKENITRIKYPYIWNFDKENRPQTFFYLDKIHSRKDYMWTHPVHEVLSNIHHNERFGIVHTIVLNHHADDTKSRSSYLPLLELSVKEDPEDDRNMHYLGREYMFHRRYQEAIDTLLKHLSLKSAKWKDERCASMRFIARCYLFLNRKEEAKMWLKKAIKEAPYMREGYTELAKLYYYLKKYKLAIKYYQKALAICTKSQSYINEAFCWDGTIEDDLSVCYYYVGDYKKSLQYVNKALEYKPNEDRIQKNKMLIETKVE